MTNLTNVERAEGGNFWTFTVTLDGCKPMNCRTVDYARGVAIERTTRVQWSDEAAINLASYENCDPWFETMPMQFSISGCALKVGRDRIYRYFQRNEDVPLLLEPGVKASQVRAAAKEYRSSLIRRRSLQVDSEQLTRDFKEATLRMSQKLGAYALHLIDMTDDDAFSLLQDVLFLETGYRTGEPSEPFLQSEFGELYRLAECRLLWPGMIGISEAARRLGYSLTGIHNLTNRGIIRSFVPPYARRVGSTFVLESEIEKYQQKARMYKEVA